MNVLKCYHLDSNDFINVIPLNVNIVIACIDLSGTHLKPKMSTFLRFQIQEEHKINH